MRLFLIFALLVGTTSFAAEETSRTSLRPQSPVAKTSEFEFFDGYGFDINPLAHPGLHTSTLISDFSYSEILSRSGKYGRFVNDLRSAVRKNLNDRENPYIVKLYTFWEYQVLLVKNSDWKLRTLYLGTTLNALFLNGYAFMTGTLSTNPGTVALPAIAAFHGALSALAYRPIVINARLADKEFNAMIDEVNAANFEAKRIMLFSYDLVEAIALSQIQTDIQTSPKAYYWKVMKLMQTFPLAYPGFVLRAENNIGLAGQLREFYEVDRQKRSKFWKDKIDAAPSFQNPAKDTLAKGVIIKTNCEIDLK